MSSSGWQLGVFCITLLKSVFFSSVSLKKSYHLSISISMHCPHESIHLLKLKQKTTTTEDSSILRFVHWIFSRPQPKLSSKAAAQESKNRWALTSLKETWSWSDPKRLPALFHVANDFLLKMWHLFEKKWAHFNAECLLIGFFLQVMFNQIILQIQASEASPQGIWRPRSDANLVLSDSCHWTQPKTLSFLFTEKKKGEKTDDH